MIGRRVEIPVYTHAWQNGEKLGTVIQTTDGALHGWTREVWTVRLDGSRRTVMVYARDCRRL